MGRQPQQKRLPQQRWVTWQAGKQAGRQAPHGSMSAGASQVGPPWRAGAALPSLPHGLHDCRYPRGSCPAPACSRLRGCMRCWLPRVIDRAGRMAPQSYAAAGHASMMGPPGQGCACGRAPTCAHAPFVREHHHLPCFPSASACCTPDPPALPLPAQPPCCSPTGPCYPPCLMASMLPAAHPAADPLLGSEASPTCMLALLSTCLDLPSTHPAADPLLSAADRQGRAAGAPAPAAATPAGGAGAAAAGWQWRRRRRRRRQRHHKPLSCCG